MVLTERFAWRAKIAEIRSAGGQVDEQLSAERAELIALRAKTKEQGEQLQALVRRRFFVCSPCGKR